MSLIVKGIKQAAFNNAFSTHSDLEDHSSRVITRKALRPQLLTMLLGSATEAEYFDNDTFVYDQENMTANLPTGIASQEVGGRINKDKHDSYRWQIPYFGISYNVSPSDYANKRKVGTTSEYDSETAQVLKMEQKMGLAWDLFKEKQMLHLLTTDTNDLAGSPAKQFNFQTEIVGTPRVTATVSFAGAPSDQTEALRAQKKLLKEEMVRYGEISNEIICVCGGDAFKKALELEANEGLARPLKGTFDFSSQEVTTMGLGTDAGYEVDWFRSDLTGITFIDYSMEIDGVGIGADDAYMFPRNAENLVRLGYAPAVTREYANTVALPVYAWNAVDEFVGITRWEQSNFLAANVSPTLIRKMVFTD